MKKVNVILCTYNGEKYIEKQLNSIFNQTYQNLDIYIYDDGSKDNTLNIIENMKIHNKTDKNIVIMKGTENRGYPNVLLRHFLM